MKSLQNSEGFYQKPFIIVMSILICIWLVFLVFGDENQLNIFFMQGQAFFGDFVYGWTASRDPYNWGTGSMDLAANLCYPPLGYLLLYPFSKITVPNAPLLLGILFYSYFYLLGFLLIFEKVKSSKKVNKYIITSLFFASSVFMFSFDRGNIIIISAMMALIFLFGFDSENKYIREISYLSLAISAGIKLYPAILGILIIKRKRYKDAIRTILYGLIAFFFPFLFFEGGIKCLPLFIRNVGLFGEQYKYVFDPAFNFKFFASHIDNIVIRDAVYHLFTIIDKVMIILAAISAYLTKEKWKEILLLSISIIWFTIHSAFYMGLFFFAGIVFFLNDSKKNRVNNLCFICIILILNPAQFMLVNKYNLSHIFTNIGVSSLAGILIFDILGSFYNKTNTRNEFNHSTTIHPAHDFAHNNKLQEQ